MDNVAQSVEIDVVELIQLAKAGDAAAQFNLGWRFAKGDGLERSDELAFHWYREAAKQGYADAQVNVGVCYEDGVGVAQDFQEAMRFYLLAASTGDGCAEFNIGNLYLSGKGRPQSYNDAFNWFKKGAEHDDPDAQFELAKMYESGLGVPVDLDTALFWYQKSAGNGVVEAKEKILSTSSWKTPPKEDLFSDLSIKELGSMADAGSAEAVFAMAKSYQNGVHVEVDLAKARELYLEAADNGLAAAQFFLGIAYQCEECRFEYDLDEASRWLLAAAENGHCEAQFEVGIFYEKGEGFDWRRNIEESSRWYHMAADQGHVEAAYRLAVYFSGENNRLEAAHWLHLASEKGHRKALYQLALAYESGSGVIKDLDKAHNLFESARSIYAQDGDPYLDSLDLMHEEARLGSTEAQYKLGLYYEEEYHYSWPNKEESPEYWFMKAALNGHAESQYRLALLLDSDEEAKKWMKLAATEGNNNAVDWLLGKGFNDDLVEIGIFIDTSEMYLEDNDCDKDGELAVFRQLESTKEMSDGIEQLGGYMANDASTVIDEVFSGKCSVEEAVEKLRTRLLDLSARNRLLNYRYPKGRCVQIADNPSINLVFDRLYIDGKAVPFKSVPEPSPDSYEGKRPEARHYAPRLGIDVFFDFPPNPESSDGHRLHGIQTLLYPADLERQLRKIAGEAKTAIEETGTNMLFLVFGFLEFYDSEDSGKPMLAPLLSLPVAIVRGEIDRDTRTYQYTVQHNGEDLAENHTLREKLRRDFMLSIPEFGEEDEPERYFARLEQAIRTKRRWKVRRQITLGMFSFGKLAIWADLDTKKNQGLPAHELIQSVFSGGTDSGGGCFHAEDYKIDERPEAAQPLIYDADSSQHSAIIDVLSGKNLVINGPPGTGKSQTITNVIASGISSGKKVLFVSEKLAALEVVRHRLNQAGLGHFCLELHSHKTQKKKFLEDIKARIEEDFPAPPQFQSKLAILQRQKTELARYAELMGSRVGNALGLTVNELFWAAERRRQELGDLAAQVNAVGFPDAAGWTHDDLERRRSRLAGLAEVYDGIGEYGSTQPWWGFRPSPLAPSDDELIARIVLKALDYARDADDAASEAVAWFGLREQPDASSASSIAAALQSVPPIPRGLVTGLLEKLFDQESDPKGLRSSRLIADVASGVGNSRNLFASAAAVLADGRRIPDDEMAEARALSERRQLASQLLSADIGAALEAVKGLEVAIESFDAAARAAAPQYAALGRVALNEFAESFADRFVAGLAPYSVKALSERSASVRAATERLALALTTINAVASRWGLPFDGSPNAVAKLADPDGFEMLSKGIVIDDALLVEARELAASGYAGKSLDELRVLRGWLERHVVEWREALFRCRSTSENAGRGFDSSPAALAELVAVAQVATDAPKDLLDYRSQSFEHPRTAELIGRARRALAVENEGRERFSSMFYLDTIPSVAEIKSSVTALRSKDGLFAFFDSEWRKAKRLHAGICREKRKLRAKECSEELAALASWIDARDAFLCDQECKTAFGGLFRGLETDPDMVARLYGWYHQSKSKLAACPGLSDKVNLTLMGSGRLAELATKFTLIEADVLLLSKAESNIQRIFGSDIAGFHDALSKGWDDAMVNLDVALQNLTNVIHFFESRASSSLSPKAALRLMEGKLALTKATGELAVLLEGEKSVRLAGGDELGSLASLSGGLWSEAIKEIFSRASKAAEIAAQARSFAGEDVPLAAAFGFVKAKLALDSAWEAVAALPVWNRFQNWNALANAAREDASAARGILEKLSAIARSGVSACRVFSAAAEEAEARSILLRYSDSPNVRRVLGELFSGVETDLDGLATTHAWGSAVSAQELPASVRKCLLSEGADEALDIARRLYARIDLGCREARAAMEGLSSFGTFSWDDWQASARGHIGRDFPADIVARLYTPAGNPGSVLPWSKYLSLRLQAREEGLGDFVTALEARKLPSRALAAAFELAAYQSIGRSVYRAFPELSRFNGVAHEQTRDAYRALDSEIISITGRIFANQIAKNARVPEGQRGTTVGEFTEMQLLQREINKKKKHIPIRQLVKRAGNALLELKPCFMMGPLSVAQYIEQGALKFDLVVMDEASQLRPEEALGAISRGAQLVVVGDPKQLPPTSFFDRMLDAGDDEDDDDAPAAISGMESILDICQQLFTPVRSLRWHYRSHHESLIAFSNHHFYKNLVVFPSPYAKNPWLGVKYRYVRSGVYKDRQNVPEAQRLVDSVLEHMLKHPDESLGVVTLNQAQRELIEELLDKKLKTFEEGAEFISRWEAEGWPLFVKNLENVQGDERDVIFISTTFGKAVGTDKVRQNFGPISRPDGWRRLNVLFTRSKRRVELFTSLSPEDIVVDEKTPLGTKALRDYLDFAKRGILVTTDEGGREPDSDFEVSVANVVAAMGFEVMPQLGVAGYFIDMAVRNPDRPGEFLAGIECDGATYHSGFSVRDRDRIRQEILESLGWKGRIYRIWSTDWFYNPRGEIERLRAFLDERRRLSALEEPVEIEEVALKEPETCAEMVADEEAGELAAEIAAEIAEGADADDVFVEVGDRVTYCPVDDPADRHSILIVDSDSNVKMGLVNENAPLAQALLGLSPGEEGELVVQGGKNRRLRVIKVLRQEALLA